MASVLDAETADQLRADVIPDEGRHVKIGRLVLQEFATSDAVRDRCLQVQRAKLDALRVSHGRTMSDARRLSAAGA